MAKIKGVVKNLLKNHKKYIISAVILLVIILFFVLKGDSKTEAYVVKEGNVSQSVELSGKVTTSDKADLGFASSGRIGKIYVINNQLVKKGQILAQLEIGELLADLKIKQLNSKTSNADLEDAKEKLSRVTKQEDTKVRNAYRKLITDGLKLVPEFTGYGVEAPTVTGTYEGEEGTYKVSIDKENVTRTDYRVSTFGLEATKNVLNKQGPTPLGSKGLYISFPDEDVSSYKDTVWYLDIPNKTSSSYVVNLNAYNEAKDARELNIKNAQSEYNKLLVEDNSGSSIASAEIDKIYAEIRKNTIYAPFDGKVTNIEKDLGENASTGERIVSILGENRLEIVLQVSELDVSKIVPDSSVLISIDAIPQEKFNGIVKTVNSRETEIEGVPVYEAFIELDPDPRIKTGMSASGNIVLAKKDNVIIVPAYMIDKKAGSNFVTVLLANGKTEEREISVGIIGTDNLAEIVSGLSVGEKILPIVGN